MAHLKRSVCSAFEIPVTPPSKKPKPTEDEVEHLVLAPFNAYPKVLFQGIKIKTSATRTVMVKNPTNVDIHVELCKLPEESRGFEFSATEFIVPIGGEESLHIKWCPVEVGSWRDIIKVKNKVKNVYVSEIIVSSSSVAPEKVTRNKNRSLQPITTRHSLTTNTTVKKSENINAAGVNRYTLTDITNNKTVIYETIPFTETLLKKQEALSKENSPTVTPGKEDTFLIRKERDSAFLQCNTPSSVPRRETYNVNKGDMLMPATSSPISQEGISVVQGERYSVDSLEGCVLYDSLEGQLSKGESNSEPSDSSFQAKIDTIRLQKAEAFIIHIGEELKTKSVSIKSGVTFKTKRRSVGKDGAPQKGKRKCTGRRSCRRSINHIENKEDIVETENSMKGSSETQTTSIDMLVERGKIGSCRRSTFDITEGGITSRTVTLDNNKCLKSSVVITEKEGTVESTSKSTSRRSTFSLTRNENMMCRKSPVKEAVAKTSRTSTSRRSTFNVSNREMADLKENNMCERSSVLPLMKEGIAGKARNSLSRRSSRIIDKQVLPDKHLTSEQRPKILSSHSTNTTVHSSEIRNRTFRKPSSFAIGIKKAAAVRRLVLSTVSSTSSGGGENQDENAEEVIHKISNPDPFIAFTICDPFSIGSIYLDEEWLDTQEKELIKWVNTMLTPPKELKENFEAPANTVLHRLNAVRRATTSLLCSPEISVTLSKVKVAVDKKLIAVRNDRNLHVDIGMQFKVLQLLLCYNPLWLRLGLEAVYGRAIPLRSNSDITGLSTFIRKHLLSDDYIKTSHCHHTVPHLMLPEFEEKMKKFTLCKFLMLIYVLDQAKNRKLIHHNPCLFCLDSQFKSSREILLEFYKDLLSGMGDVMKQLRQYGYQLTYKQTYLDEFDFTVKTRLDLRDGIRLTRLAELIVQDSSLCSKLRVPPISRLQKVHNVEIAMKAFAEANYTFVGDITSKSIVDGHKEKTLSLLWQLRRVQQEYAVKLIIIKWRETRQLIQDRKQFLKARNAVVRIQKWYRKMKQERKLCRRQMEFDRNKFLSIRKAVVKIQQWYRANKLMRIQHERYCKLRNTVIYVQRKYKNIYLMRKIRSNYLKMKQSAIIIQRYYRMWKLMIHDRKVFLDLKIAVIKIQQIYRLKQFRKKKEEEFVKQNLAASKIQKWYRSIQIVRKYVSDFVNLKTAIIFVQNKFRANKKMKYERDRYIKLRASTIIIQRAVKNYLTMRLHCCQYLQMKHSALIIQRFYRATKLMRTERSVFLKLKEEVVFVQRKFRANTKMKHERHGYIQIKNAALTIQKAFRNYQSMKHDQQQYLKIKTAALILQKWFRARQLMKIIRSKYLQLKSATVLIQNKFRAYMKMKHERNRYLEILNSTISIQRAFRNYQIMKQDHLRYFEMKFAAITIQNYFRATVLMKKERSRYLKLKSSVVFIETKYKAIITMKHERIMYLKVRNAAITIQKVFRGYLLMKQDRSRYLQRKMSALVIQKYFRANQMMKTEMSRYLALKKSVVFTQTKFRANVLMKFERSRYLKIRNSVVTIQKAFRRYQLAKQDRCRFLEMKSAALILQKYFRSLQMMKTKRSKYLALKHAVVFIQNTFRANRKMKSERDKYLRMRNAAVSIQKIFRSFLIMKSTRARYVEMKCAVVVIQKHFKSWHAMKRECDSYMKLKRAVILIQNKFRANVKMRNLRNEYVMMRNAVLTIQRAFRAKKLMIQEYNKYTELKSAVVLVQRRFRARQLMKREYTKYLRIKSAVMVIQKQFRNQKAIMAAKTIYLERKTMKLEEEKKHKAATVIQALWRGYRCRKAVNIDVKKSRTSDPVKQIILRERSKDILDNLMVQPRSVKQIIACLYTLDTVTTLSSKLCREFVDGGIVPRLYHLLDSTCRSTCDVDIAEITIKVIINLYKYDVTANRTWEIQTRIHLLFGFPVPVVIHLLFLCVITQENRTEDGYVFVSENVIQTINKDTVKVNGSMKLLDQMMQSYIKQDHLFCNAVTLLWLFAQDASKAKVILSIPKASETLKYISRKSHDQKPKCAAKTKLPAKIVHELPNTKHDWGYYEKPTVFTNKQVALESLLKILNII